VTAQGAVQLLLSKLQGKTLILNAVKYMEEFEKNE
jgi:hypothetical protein